MIQHIEQAFAQFARWSSSHLGRAHVFVAYVAANVAFEIWNAIQPLSDVLVNAINFRVSNFSIGLLLLLQASQNREGKERKIESQEMIRATEGARNEVLRVGEMTETELEEFEDRLKE